MRLFLAIILCLVFLGILGLENTQTTLTLFLNAVILTGMGVLLSFYDIKKIILLHRTPTCAINALPAAGRVGIAGKTQSASINSPYSGTACVYWHAELEMEKRDPIGSNNASHWETIQTTSSPEPFEIIDDTGETKIFPQRSEILLQNNSGEVSGAWDTGDGRALRFYEQLIKPDRLIYVLGKIKPVDKFNSYGDKILPLIISTKTHRQLLTALYARVTGRAFLALLTGELVNLALFYGWLGLPLGN